MMCATHMNVLLQVFYPFVLFYMIAAFLQGGAGTASMGMLNNLRQYLWIPITQDAFRQVGLIVTRYVILVILIIS